MALTKINHRMVDGESLNILDFGADPTGATDSTAAIQAAINSTNQPVGIYIPSGVYLVTETINLTRPSPSLGRTIIYGDGISSRINFVPTANDVCFNVDNGAGAANSVVYVTFKDIGIFSNDTTYSKTAFLLTDISSCVFDNVHTTSPHWTGGASGSIVFHIRSRQTSSFRDITAYADRPILISPDPDSSIIGIDHFNFHNIYLGNIFASAYPLIEIEDGVILTQVSFTGYQAWVGGAGGFKWVSTTNAASSFGLTFENVRYENSNDPNNTYFMNINQNYSLYNLSIKGGQTGVTKGIFLRNVQYVSIEDFSYTDSSREALNVDTTVGSILTKNCLWQTGSTASLTGHELSNAQSNLVSGPIRETGFYAKTTASGFPYFENNATLQSSVTTLAVDAVAKIGGATQTTILTVSIDGAGKRSSAIYLTRGALLTVAEISDPDGDFTVTKNNAGTVNIYWDSGNSRYEIQNKLAAEIQVFVQKMGKSY